MKFAENRIHVVVLDDWDGITAGSRAIERLREVANVTSLGLCSDKHVLEQVDADVIIPIRERRNISSELIAQLPLLRHIAQTGGSTSHIDLEAARKAGITVSMTPGASAVSVAELAIALMIASRRGITRGNFLLKDGSWERPLGRQLSGATLGVVGWGATGKRLGLLATALGMNVILHSRRAGGSSFGGFPRVGLDELFERADIVSLHVELSAETRGLVTRALLRKLGPKGLLINTARAALVDRDDLLKALEAGELGSAGLDVFHAEPPEFGDEIVNHPSVVATPHLGWRTDVAMETYLEGAVDNIIEWLKTDEHEEEQSK
jgi:phosphoglycerate dehydrogenase-like enzyme